MESLDGMDAIIKPQEPTGKNLILVLRRSENRNPVVVDKVLTSLRSSTDVPMVFNSREKRGTTNL